MSAGHANQGSGEYCGSDMPSKEEGSEEEEDKSEEADKENKCVNSAVNTLNSRMSFRLIPERVQICIYQLV